MITTGKIKWAATYDSFGNAQVITEDITNNLRFAGQYYDGETGLHYNWDRYYDPQTGRYTRIDPIGFAGGDLNLYAYVKGNAVNWADPWGLMVYNFSDNPVRVRPEIGNFGYIVPPRSSADISPDAVQNPVTGNWTKFRGWLITPENSVSIDNDGTPKCIGGTCMFTPEETGDQINKDFGNPEGGFKPYPNPGPLPLVHPKSCN